MKERGATIIGALVLLLVLLPLGFLVHAAPRFPGSLLGSLVGIVAALLIIVSLTYPVVKRIPWLHDRVTKHASPRTLLTLHIYAGIAGPILGIVHAAHKFNSPLGISLTGIMILVVLSGYVGRYLLAQVSRALRGRKSELAALRGAFPVVPTALPARTVTGNSERGGAFAWGWIRRLFVVPDADIRAGDSPDPAQVAGAIADVEYAIRSEEVANRLLGRWLALHIALAIIMMLLLVLHVWAGLYYGLRWL